jgi:uncharacterized UPF0160 family protein
MLITHFSTPKYRYDEATNRFDHHQREFTGVLEGYQTKLSSAGLVYKHFGHDIIRQVLKGDDNAKVGMYLLDASASAFYFYIHFALRHVDTHIHLSCGSFHDPKSAQAPSLSSENIHKLHTLTILFSPLNTNTPTQIDEAFVNICFHKLYKGFIEHVDAIDNGISVSDGPARYHVSTTLSSRVGSLNPAWNEPQSADIYNTKFMDAMQLTCTEFVLAAQVSMTSIFSL